MMRNEREEELATLAEELAMLAVLYTGRRVRFTSVRINPLPKRASRRGINPLQRDGGQQFKTLVFLDSVSIRLMSEVEELIEEK